VTAAQCPSCSTWTDKVGETEFDDRGPFQLVAVRRYVCPECGRRWTLETDGS
jgi:transposase-like protein